MTTRKLPPEKVQRIIFLSHSELLDRDEIAERVGCSALAVTQVLDAYASREHNVMSIQSNAHHQPRPGGVWRNV